MTENPASEEESEESEDALAKRSIGRRRESGVVFRDTPTSAGSSKGAGLIPEVLDEPKVGPATKMSLKIVGVLTDDDDEEDVDDDDQSIDIEETDNNDQSESDDEDQVMKDAEKNDAEKPLCASNYGNQFLNFSPERSLLGTVKESANTEITFMVNVQIQPEITSVLSAPLLDVLTYVDPPTPTTLTPTPLTTPLLPSIISETSPIYNEVLATLFLDSNTFTVDEDELDRMFPEQPNQRRQHHKDKDQDPPGGSDQGMKKSKKGKDAEPSKRPKSIGSSKATTQYQPKSTRDDMGNTDEQPKVEAALKYDWFKKPPRPPTPDLE
ncbi:hypothetical protein Tco_1010126 [Tanacetum coccineum]